MKHLITTIILVLTCFYSFSQGRKELTDAEVKQDTLDDKDVDIKGINFGISFGFNNTFGGRLYDARISPIDTTLVLERISSKSFLLSTTISFPLTGRWMGGRYYRALDDKGKPYGDPYFVPSGISFVASINLVAFNSALGGAGIFNQKLDGGLGFAYSFGDNAQIALTYELLSFLQPREYILKMEGEKIKVNGQNITSLPTDNNDYFINKYHKSLSIKIIYILNKKK